MLLSEYTTSCITANSVVWYNSYKQAGQTFHCFVLNSRFIQPSECKSVSFPCLSVRLQVSFIPLRFQYFGRWFSFRTVDLPRESRVVAPALRFSQKRIETIYCGRCRPRKLKSVKNNPMILRQNRENLATRKYPIIRYRGEAKTMRELSTLIMLHIVTVKTDLR